VVYSPRFYWTICVSLNYGFAASKLQLFNKVVMICCRNHAGSSSLFSLGLRDASRPNSWSADRRILPRWVNVQCRSPLVERRHEPQVNVCKLSKKNFRSTHLTSGSLFKPLLEFYLLHSWKISVLVGHFWCFTQEVRSNLFRWKLEFQWEPSLGLQWVVKSHWNNTCLICIYLKN